MAERTMTLQCDSCGLFAYRHDDKLYHVSRGWKIDDEECLCPHCNGYSVINELVLKAHENAKDKGFWDTPRDSLVYHMLMLSEIVEASEEVRNGTPFYYISGPKNKKPCGEAVELADCVIRIMDYFGFRGWDLERVIRDKMNYNLSRPYMHNKKI